eukprot:CAMPEP_0194078084 /NCGR_PEP_ID=MMETSP0149-20130528/4561_1 /TAXON_ID=122233 /ORGANISM="Chaetoceros debilis, Strain MM31A-1" /LENGTH=84 /DNA_ID=CAMNT_0038759265 /DNA_START=358 /DNA_END=612 /DNA_ORIENTATION=+
MLGDDDESAIGSLLGDADGITDGTTVGAADKSTVFDVLGPSDGMLDGRYEGMADFSDGTAVTAGARVRSHVLQVFLQTSLDGEK